MKTDLRKLSALAKPWPEESRKKAEERKANRDWLEMAQDITLALHYHMRASGITQKDLAEAMGVSPTYVAKLMKGGENLQLSTICKLQRAVGERLVSVPRPYRASGEVRLCETPRIRFTGGGKTYEYHSEACAGYATAGDVA